MTSYRLLRAAFLCLQQDDILLNEQHLYGLFFTKGDVFIFCLYSTHFTASRVHFGLTNYRTLNCCRNRDLLLLKPSFGEGVAECPVGVAEDVDVEMHAKDIFSREDEGYDRSGLLLQRCSGSCRFKRLTSCLEIGKWLQLGITY